jgi:hypothetical protein
MKSAVSNSKSTDKDLTVTVAETPTTEDPIGKPLTRTLSSINPLRCALVYFWHIIATHITQSKISYFRGPTMASPSDIPPFVAPIIQAYATAIRPAFSFILISAIFPAMLLLLLILLLLFSTPRSRRQPIIIMNTVNMLLGIFVGALCIHLVVSVCVTLLSAIP